MSNRSRKFGINFESGLSMEGVPTAITELADDLEELVYLIQDGLVGDEEGQLSVFDWLSDLEFIGDMASNLKRELESPESIPSIEDVIE